MEFNDSIFYYIKIIDKKQKIQYNKKKELIKKWCYLIIWEKIHKVSRKIKKLHKITKKVMYHMIKKILK